MMMQTEKSNQKIMEQYRLYCLQREQRQREEAEEKARREAEFQARDEQLRKACMPRTVTTRTVHTCTGCGATIPAKSRVVVEGEVQRVVFMYSQGASMRRVVNRYYCVNCRKAGEAQ
jgi:5-methylcytosine-specific restriction endonuclease McrA